MSLLLQWASKARSLVIVGDPFQNLYEWRGSDSTVLTSIIGNAKRTRTLVQSYRVPREVYSEACRWVRPLIGDIDYDYKPRDHDGAVVHNGPQLNNPEWLVNEIERDTRQFESVMLLASCSYMVTPVISVMRDPVRAHSGGPSPCSPW